MVLASMLGRTELSGITTGNTLYRGTRRAERRPAEAPEVNFSASGESPTFPKTWNIMCISAGFARPCQLGGLLLAPFRHGGYTQRWNGKEASTRHSLASMWLLKEQECSPSTATLSKAGTSGRKSTRASLCRKNTRCCSFPGCRKSLQDAANSRRLCRASRSRKRFSQSFLNGRE